MKKSDAKELAYAYHDYKIALTALGQRRLAAKALSEIQRKIGVVIVKDEILDMEINPYKS